ncbi:MAG: hypothetical protein HQK73_03955, partial [Desulfamplus sp.]|nr:hypothetical protein [Desulfamplus sp.]
MSKNKNLTYSFLNSSHNFKNRFNYNHLLSKLIVLMIILISFILLSPFEALCIYDQVAFDIKIKDSKISISLKPDYNQYTKPFTNMYVAAVIGSDIYFLYKNGDNLSLEQFNSATEPPSFIKKNEKGEIPEIELMNQWDINWLDNILLFAGIGSSLTDMLNSGSLVCFYDGQQVVLPQPARKWTVMVYMVGSDLEGGFGSSDRKATNDIMQMIQGSIGLNPDTVNVVLTTGGSTRKGWDSVRRSWIYNGQYYNIEDMKNLNMGNPDTLSDFVLWSKEQFPAEHYALIMWDHGMGTDGFGIDMNHINPAIKSNNTLVFSKLNEAFNKISRDAQPNVSTQNPLDIVLYDACLMGTIEVAQLVSKITGVMGGSANTEPGFGFDYKALLQGIETKQINNGIDFGRNASDAYILECTNNGKFDSSKTKITYSIFDLTKLNDFNQEFDLLSDEFLNIMQENSSSSYNAISVGLIRTITYPIGKIQGTLDRGVSIPNPVDLVGFLENVGERFPSLSNRAESLIKIILEKLVVYYNGNIAAGEGVNENAGRLTIDVGKESGHIKFNDLTTGKTTMLLPESYSRLNQAMISYYE